MTRRKLYLLVACAILMVAIGPYVISRVRSLGRQVRVRGNTQSQAIAAEPLTRIRMLTYNIAHGRGPTDDNWDGTVSEKKERVESISKFITQTNADVVVLNEVDFSSTWSGHQNQAEAIAASAGYPFWVEQRNLDLRFVYGSWKFGNAILSRFPIVDAETFKFPPLRSIERILVGCKVGAVCTLQVSDTQQIKVIPVHLEHRSEDIRVASAQMIINAAQSSSVPLIALGDFNSTPSYFPGFESSSGGQNAMDLLMGAPHFQLNAATAPTRSELTFSSQSPDRVIDWILIPDEWEFTEYRVLQSELSDHLPVVAEIQLPTEPGI